MKTLNSYEAYINSPALSKRLINMSDSILEIMRNKGGYATMKELKEAGIHTRKVREALEKEWKILEL
jgi:hypothetical protein